MPKSSHRPRLFAAPYPETVFDAWIDAITEEPNPAGSKDIVFTLRTLRLLVPLKARLIDGQPREVGRGEYVPMRLRFTNATWLALRGPFERFAELAPDDEVRHLFWIQHARLPELDKGIHTTLPEAKEFFWIMTNGIVEGEMTLRAQSYALEEIAEAESSPPVEVVRRYALTPQSPEGVMPHRPALYRRYGGDPITIHLGKRTLHNRLFIGGLRHQREKRPHVDYVLNLCGIQNPWCAHTGAHPNDRFIYRGEMAVGMDTEAIVEEARWVVERLRAGKRVLVHCYAGVNRSSTVACASLILLEGMSADEALARVREHHPIAWPDPYHWFLLRWLAHSREEHVTTARGVEADAQQKAPLLREPISVQ